MTPHKVLNYVFTAILMLLSWYGAYRFLETLPKESLNRPIEVNVIQDGMGKKNRVVLFSSLDSFQESYVVAKEKHGKDVILGTLQPGDLASTPMIEDSDVKPGGHYTYKVWPLTNEAPAYAVPIRLDARVPSATSCLIAGRKSISCSVE